MHSFLKIRNGLPFVYCFILLYLALQSTALNSAAHGDPSRIPNNTELQGLAPESNIAPLPACAANCTDIGAAFNSSLEIWCTTTLFGGCVTTANFIRMSTFCSDLTSVQCPSTQCSLPGEPEAILHWANNTCNLAWGGKNLWNPEEGRSNTVSWISGIATLGLLAAAVVTHFLSTAAHTSPNALNGVNGAQNPPTPDTQAAQAHTGASHHSPSVDRMDPLALLLQFQTISSTGLLSLNYPLLYRGFTVNFAWANFILPIPSLLRALAPNPKCKAVLSSGGIASYAAHLKIDEQAVFSVAYVIFLVVCAILLGIHLIVLLAIHIIILQATEDEKRELWLNRRTRWHQITSNNSLRLMNIALGSLLTFLFFQWTQQCTSGPVAFASATALLIIVGSVAFVTFLILRRASRPGGIQSLFSKDSPYARRWGSLYDTLKETKLPFLVVLFGSSVLRRGIIGLLQISGLAQNISLILLESAMFVALLIYKPYYSTGYNQVNYMIAATNIASQLLLLPFNKRFNLNPRAARGLAALHITLHSIVLLVLVVLTVMKQGWGRLWFRNKHAVFEKGNETGGVA